jgi:hypothetical protein
MKYLVLLSASLLFVGCANSLGGSKKVQVNNIPAKKTYVKKEAPSAPSNRSYYYRNGYYYGNGYYYEPLGNGPLTHQGSPEDVDNINRRVD